MGNLPRNAHIHVIDGDFRRRAQISSSLVSRGLHTEIYESPAEFLSSLPAEGSVLLNEAPHSDDLSQFFGTVRSRGRYFPIAVYCEAPAPQRIVRAIRNGAVDYLLWPFENDLFETALLNLIEEGDRQSTLAQERGRAEAKLALLTKREIDVLVSLLDGNSNKEVAEELAISPRTVEIYRKNMMFKLNAKSASEAARIAIYAGLWDVRGRSARARARVAEAEALARP